jgi:hypothetical protein
MVVVETMDDDGDGDQVRVGFGSWPAVTLIRSPDKPGGVDTEGYAEENEDSYSKVLIILGSWVRVPPALPRLDIQPAS